jgi:uncharacterized membrane protein (UPF0182 family)
MPSGGPAGWLVERIAARIVGRGTIAINRNMALEVPSWRTLESIRMWDPVTLQNTFAQLQELRTYYDFRDVDVDRYDFGDGPEQVMVSVREINENDLPDHFEVILGVEHMR